MSKASKLKEAPVLAGGREGYLRWWLAPDGELNPCSEHEYAAREILRRLELPVPPGRKLYDQMFNRQWVRVAREKSRILYETSRSQLREANSVQLRSLKTLAIKCGVELYNATTKRVIVLESIE